MIKLPFHSGQNKRNLIPGYIILAFVFQACYTGQLPDNDSRDTFLPNILVISCEDISPQLGCYGDPVALTPNLDKLASDGVRYNNVFAVAGVCAPARCAIITGMYPTSIGGHNMRTPGRAQYQPVPPYSIVPPPEVKCYSEILRDKGYYCTNNSKEDYQFIPPPTAWDESNKHAHWKNRPEGKPFFAVFNITTTHEHMIWANKKKPLLADPEKVTVPPYYPDNMIVRKTIARNYSNIHSMDSMVGVYLKELDEAGLSDSTIVIFFSDGGGPLPRQKREITDAGLRVPFLVRYPGKRKAGTVNNDLISFVDFAPTFLSLASIVPPPIMQGQAFLGKYKVPEKRKYIFSARDRMDTEYDMVRSVRGNRYAYFKNYYPEKPYYQNIQYRLNMEMMRNILRLHKEQKLNNIQESWFKSKPVEELYDIKTDPYELHNLAGNPAYKNKLTEFRHELYKWQYTYGDMGFIPEKELIHIFWQSKDGPQKTTLPKAGLRKDGKLHVSCSTAGASIGYRIVGRDKPEHWEIYNSPLSPESNTTIRILAWRIGFRPSDTITYSFK